MPLSHCGGMTGVEEETQHVYITEHAKRAAMPCPLPTQASELMRCLTIFNGLNDPFVVRYGLRGTSMSQFNYAVTCTASANCKCRSAESLCALWL